MSPGSKIAKEKGCLCDPNRNRFGMGVTMPHIRVPLYIKHEDCPFHGVIAEVEKHGSGRSHQRIHG